MTRLTVYLRTSAGYSQSYFPLGAAPLTIHALAYFAPLNDLTPARNAERQRVPLWISQNGSPAVAARRLSLCFSLL